MGVQEVHNGFAAELGPTHVETLKAKGNLVRKMHRTSDSLTLVLISTRELSVVVLPQAACLAKSGRLEDSKMLIGQVAQSCAEHHGPPLLLLLLWPYDCSSFKLLLLQILLLPVAASAPFCCSAGAV